MTSRAKKIRNVFLSMIGIALTLAVVLSLGVITVLNLPTPKRSGEVQLTGIDAEVRILRDANSIPHIYAASDTDLFFAQGYVHAQERFFEMDYRRHLTGGRLAELVGDVEAAKQADVVIRTMGWRAIAAQEWELLSSEAQGFYEAYAQGVNAYIAEKAPWELANEYAVLRLSLPVKDIEPWSGIDSLAWLKAMAWDLKENIDDEIARVAAYQSLQDTAAVEALFPAYAEAERTPVVPSELNSNLAPRASYPRETPGAFGIPTLADSAGDSANSASSSESENSSIAVSAEVTSANAAASLATANEALLAVPEILGQDQGVGSNSFVVSGEHTASGLPVLANDPHLTISYPSVWFQIGLHCVALNSDCTFDVSGFSFAGMPGVIIGRNPDLAWGLTNLGGDVTDFVLEKNLSPTTYEVDGEAVEYEIWEEEFQVAGGESFTAEVRRSVHGPIVSGALLADEVAAALPHAPSNFSVALEWTALKPDTTGEAIFAINRAKNVADIKHAASLFAVPAQNILFATKTGDIGYQAPGRFPVRPVKAAADGQLGQAHSADNLGADGRWPRPGWDSSYDWQGYYAASDMPALLNPEEGFIVPANQQITPAELGPYLGSYSDAGFRSQQIREQLENLLADGDFSIEDANAVMLLESSPYGYVLGAELASATLDDARSKQMQGALAEWIAAGSHAGTEEIGMTIAAAVYSHLLDQTLGANISEFKAVSGARYIVLLEQLFADPQAALWDNPATDAIETKDAAIENAFAAADADLTAQLGSDIDGWQWGKAHKETPEHSVLGGESIPQFIRNLFNEESRAVPGGSAIPNAMNFSPAVSETGQVSFEVTSGPSMRMAVDLADVDTATWIISSGVSGHPRSKHVSDQFAAWATGETLSWHFSEAAVTAAKEDELVLIPNG